VHAQRAFGPLLLGAALAFAGCTARKPQESSSETKWGHLEWASYGLIGLAPDSTITTTPLVTGAPFGKIVSRSRGLLQVAMRAVVRLVGPAAR